MHTGIQQESPSSPKDNSSQDRKESPSQLPLKEQSQLKSNELNEDQNNRIRAQIFSLFRCEELVGKIKVKDFESFDHISIVLYHKNEHTMISETLDIHFSESYPSVPPSITALSQQFIAFPKFLCNIQELEKGVWHQNTQLSTILVRIYSNFQVYHRNQMMRIKNIVDEQANSYNEEKVKMEDEDGQQEGEEEGASQHDLQMERSQEKNKKQRRKSSYMNGCADKELTQTKNLNRHFRSKLREVLRDLVTSNPQDRPQDSKFIDQIFTPNRVGFEDIRKTLSNKWFNEGVRRQMNSGQFLHKILRGMMGIKSKKLMIKYYHVMVSAVEEPNSFIRWKYD